MNKFMTKTIFHVYEKDTRQQSTSLKYSQNKVSITFTHYISETYFVLAIYFSLQEL